MTFYCEAKIYFAIEIQIKTTHTCMSCFYRYISNYNFMHTLLISKNCNFQKKNVFSNYATGVIGMSYGLSQRFLIGLKEKFTEGSSKSRLWLLPNLM